jgi:ribonuclease HII
MYMKKYIIGIDEVGRGCLAGPIVTAAFAVPAKCQISSVKCQDGKILKLKDSKKLSAKQREIWFEYFKSHKKVSWAVARVNPKTIDSINISRAANRGALSAFKKLCQVSRRRESYGGQAGAKCQDFDLQNFGVFLDGGLFLGNRLRKSKKRINEYSESIRANPPSDQRTSATTVVRGDEKIPAISAASILAKVTRDRLMVRLAKKYPQYGFEIHKGYGTKKHYEAIKEHGPSEMHRKTFLKRVI